MTQVQSTQLDAVRRRWHRQRRSPVGVDRRPLDDTVAQWQSTDRRSVATTLTTHVNSEAAGRWALGRWRNVVSATPITSDRSVIDSVRALDDVDVVTMSVAAGDGDTVVTPVFDDGDDAELWARSLAQQQSWADSVSRPLAVGDVDDSHGWVEQRRVDVAGEPSRWVGDTIRRRWHQMNHVARRPLDDVVDEHAVADGQWVDNRARRRQDVGTVAPVIVDDDDVWVECWVNATGNNTHRTLCRTSRPLRPVQWVDDSGSVSVSAKSVLDSAEAPVRPLDRQRRRASSPLVTVSAGSIGLKGARRATPFSAEVLGRHRAQRALALGIHAMQVNHSGKRSVVSSALRGLRLGGVTLVARVDVTASRHGGTRYRAARRV